MAGRVHISDWGEPPGILGLLVLIEEHRGPLEYDFRSRFPGVRGGLRAVGRSMQWGEALRLVRLLRKDTTSQFAASMEGWDFPVDRGTLATLDVYDLTVAANSDPKKGRLDPHPGRPYKLDGPKKREQFGDTKGKTDAEVISILRKLGHNLPA